MVAFNTRVMILIALLALTMMANDVKALTFVETLVDCTSNTDGFLASAIFLASGACMSFGATSFDNGCNTGSFKEYNSTNCSGDVIRTIPRDTCTTQESSTSKMIFRCSSYNDAEYLRQTSFSSEDGHGVTNCNSSLKTVSFSRLGFCYPGAEVGSLSFKYEKINATAFRGIIFNDANCNSVNRSQEGRAGTCQGSFQTDIVDANSLGNSATIAGRSIGLMILVGILGAAMMF